MARASFARKKRSIQRKKESISEIPRIILISGRVRSTQRTSRSPRYRLLYRLSYDGGHVFSEAEKEAMAHAMEDKSETVISVKIVGIFGMDRSTDTTWFCSSATAFAPPPPRSISTVVGVSLHRL